MNLRLLGGIFIPVVAVIGALAIFEAIQKHDESALEPSQEDNDEVSFSIKRSSSNLASRKCHCHCRAARLATDHSFLL